MVNFGGAINDSNELLYNAYTHCTTRTLIVHLYISRTGISVILSTGVSLRISFSCVTYFLMNKNHS